MIIYNAFVLTFDLCLLSFDFNLRVSFSGRTRPCQGRGGSSILPTRTRTISFRALRSNADPRIERRSDAELASEAARWWPARVERRRVERRGRFSLPAPVYIGTIKQAQCRK